MTKYFALLLILPTFVMGTQVHIKLSDQICNPFVKDYQRRTGLNVIGSGGTMMKDIESICLTFVGAHRLDVPAARRLYIDGVEDLLNRYNTSKKARPYLRNFPFTTDNLDFGIMFEDRPGKFVPSNFVAGVFCSHGSLCYVYKDVDLDRLVNFYEEPYQDAVRIVHTECAQDRNTEFTKNDLRKGSGLTD